MFDPEEYDGIVISNTELSEYLYTALMDFGLVPGQDEVDLIADLVFDYLWQKGLIDIE